MKWISFFLLLAVVGFSETGSPNQEIMDSRSDYERHLSPLVYQYVKEHQLIQENDLLNLVRMQYGTESGLVRVQILEENGEKLAVASYERSDSDDSLSELQIKFQNGKMISYLEFDENGIGRTTGAPFSEEQENSMVLILLDLMARGFTSQEGGIFEFNSLNFPAEYQNHFPPSTYEYAIQNHWIDETTWFHRTEGSQGTGTIVTGIDVNGNGPLVFIGYELEEPKDHIRALMLAYQNQKVFGYQIFDAEGQDFVQENVSEEDGEKVSQVLFRLIEEGIQKKEEGV